MPQVASLPRPLVIALVSVVAIAALLFATRRGGEEASTGSPPPASPPSVQAQPTPAQPGTETTTPPVNQARPESKPPRTEGGRERSRTLPTPVKRALDANKVVVLLFWNPKASDDQSVKGAVDSVSTRGGSVATFDDTIRNLARYTRVTGSEDAITQTPSLVVVDREGRATTATGFMDAATVDQYVVDALRSSR